MKKNEPTKTPSFGNRDLVLKKETVKQLPVKTTVRTGMPPCECSVIRTLHGFC